MRAVDGILIELARKAKVRPPHIFFLFHYRRAMKATFSPEGFSAFAQMDLPHVLRMIETLDAYEADSAPVRRGGGAKTKMAASYVLPNALRLWAQTEKGWTRDITDTQASKFVDYWCNKPPMADWSACWRNWVRSEYSPAGVISAGAQERWTPERMAEYRANLDR